mmetsp:Transcript_8470/g.20253  ORF Transcript_8470/g.20253 Transcript_8470/m.20253 type:complete len:522 (-) Transcript_8470:321-1886(-)
MVEKRCVCACACVLAQSSSGVQRTFCGALVSEPGSSHRSVVLAGIPSPPVPGMESVTGCRGLRRTPARSPPQNKTLRRHDAATRTSGTTTSSSQALLLLAALLVPCGNGAPRRHRTSETANRAIVCGTIALPPIAVVVAVGAAAVRRTPVRTHGCCRNGKRNPQTPSDETNASVSHLGMSEQPDQTRPDQTQPQPQPKPNPRLRRRRDPRPHGEPKPGDHQDRPEVEHFVGSEDDLSLGLVAGVPRPLQGVRERPEGDGNRAGEKAPGHRGCRRPKHQREQREDRPSVDQKDGRVENGRCGGEEPLEEGPGAGAGPDDRFDDPRKELVVSAEQPSQGGVEVGDPEENGRVVELPADVVGPSVLPGVPVEGPRDDEYRFDGKAKAEGRPEQAPASVGYTRLRCRGAESQRESHEGGIEDGSPLVELAPQDGLVDVDSDGFLRERRSFGGGSVGCGAVGLLGKDFLRHTQRRWIGVVAGRSCSWFASAVVSETGVSGRPHQGGRLRRVRVVRNENHDDDSKDY